MKNLFLSISSKRGEFKSKKKQVAKKLLYQPFCVCSGHVPGRCEPTILGKAGENSLPINKGHFFAGLIFRFALLVHSSEHLCPANIVLPERQQHSFATPTVVTDLTTSNVAMLKDTATGILTLIEFRRCNAESFFLKLEDATSPVHKK